MGERAVLVTGASTGIGRKCALHLASRGFLVFAGVRKRRDAQDLIRTAQGKLVPVRLDVTRGSEIRSAAKTVSRRIPAGASFSLVNNAGISVTGPLELLEIESLRRQFEVNVIGQIAVTQAFLPLLRERGGRIVLMGSLFGRFAVPFVGAYSGAKFALEAFADSLSMELAEWGITVTILEPGNIATPIWKKVNAARSGGANAARSGGVNAARSLYSGALGSFDRARDRVTAWGIRPLRVARAVERALAARRPRARYLVGLDAQLLGRIIPALPARLRHLIVGWYVLRR